jgi:hypothetical protein
MLSYLVEERKDQRNDNHTLFKVILHILYYHIGGEERFIRRGRNFALYGIFFCGGQVLRHGGIRLGNGRGIALCEDGYGDYAEQQDSADDDSKKSFHDCLLI